MGTNGEYSSYPLQMEDTLFKITPTSEVGWQLFCTALHTMHSLNPTSQRFVTNNLSLAYLTFILNIMVKPLDSTLNHRLSTHWDGTI